MAHHRTVGTLVQQAAKTHALTTRLSRPSPLFPAWRERRFVRAIDTLLHASTACRSQKPRA